MKKIPVLLLGAGASGAAVLWGLGLGGISPTASSSTGGQRRLASNSIGSTILDPTTRRLNPAVRYTDLVQAVTDTYLPGDEEEPSWDHLEAGLRAMKYAQKRGFQYNRCTVGVIGRALSNLQ